jgi:hypothetical protein
VLEGSLLRGEERLAKLREQTVDQNRDPIHTSMADGIAAVSSRPPAAAAAATTPFGAIPTPSTRIDTTSNGSAAGNTTRRPPTNETNPNGTSSSPPSTTPFTPFTTLTTELTTELTTPPQTRDQGRAQWQEFLRDRVIRGGDEDFDYAVVDDDDEYDVLERVEREEAWFEAEDPGWVDGGSEGEGRGRGRVLRGETGVQDF